MSARLLLLAALLFIAPAYADHQTLDITLDSIARTLEVDAEISVDRSGSFEIALGNGFVLSALEIDGVAASQPAVRDDEHKRLRWRLALPERAQPHTVRMHYRGRLAPIPDADHREVLNELPPSADPHGTFLPAGSGWHPELSSGAFSYRVRVAVPQDQRVVVPGNLVGESEDGRNATFELLTQADGIDLMAGPYAVRERVVKLKDGTPLRLRTYFHAEVAELADGYLDSAAGYLERYSQRIGPYAYRDFSIVSSVLPTGLGMPTLTYLGIDVLRLPFIRTTSLGHEVLHNWWGNGVNVDWAHGNWSEGLTTFMADYAFKEDDSSAAARAMRLDWLRDFAAVPAERDAPLRSFTSRTHDASQIVGYNKTAFIFFMLRDELGADVFESALRDFYAAYRFRAATWNDLEAAFEQASGRKLDAFFTQWLDRTGAPTVRIENARIEGDRLSATLAQSAPPYALRVPLAVTPGAMSVVPLATTSAAVTLAAPDHARSLDLDPDLRLFRHLSASELPPILRQVTLDPASIVVLLSKSPQFEDAARALAQRMMDNQPRFGTRDELAASKSALVVGLEKDVDAWLTPAGLTRPFEVSAKGTAQVWTAQKDGQHLLVVSARYIDALKSLLRPLPHYGKQSWLVFEESRAIERGVWEGRAQGVGFK